MFSYSEKHITWSGFLFNLHTFFIADLSASLSLNIQITVSFFHLC